MMNYKIIEYKNEYKYDIRNLISSIYKDEFELGIHPINSKAIIEIDSIEELAMIDRKYKKYLEKQYERHNNEN